MAKIIIDKNKCKVCKLCVMYCPLGLIKISSEMNNKGLHYAVFKGADKCSGCCICAKMCPDAAIEVYKDKKNG